MLLQKGHWLGRGSVLVEGQSLGQTAECDVRIEQDDGGFTLHAELTVQDSQRSDFLIRVAGNEVGTYTLRVAMGAEVLNGTAKLDSPPNLGLLWNEAENVYATFALFAISDGCGFRGFVRDGLTTFTWEIAFALKQDVVKGDNVISLNRRTRGRSPRRI